MKVVRVERTTDGYLIDAAAYLEHLSTLAPSLPAGARAFASDAQHYNFNSQRFIKNLKPQHLISGETDGVSWLELQLRHNCWRHEEDLTIRYCRVHSMTLDPPEDEADVSALREVLLDEVLPHDYGCSHEIACLGRSLRVVCEDLTATWLYADCPERQAGSDPQQDPPRADVTR